MPAPVLDARGTASSLAAAAELAGEALMPPPASTASFGQWVRQRRKAVDLTQEALGRLVSCSPHAIRKIEANERRPSRRLTERLAEQLKVAQAEYPTFVAAARGALLEFQGPRDIVGFEPEAVAERDASSMPFVGRELQSRRLRQWLAQLPTRRGCTVLVEGEAGIGKTRLIGELCRHAQRADLRVAGSKCYAIERHVAYRALVDLIEQALAGAPAGFEQGLDSAARAELAVLVPHLARRWAGLPTLSAEVPQARQVRLSAAAVALFEVLAEPHGLLLVLDDLQWIDDASAQVLLDIAAHSARGRLLVVLACRSEDLLADARLAGMVADLDGRSRLERMALPALSRAELHELLQRLQAGTPGAELAQAALADHAVFDALYAHCHGNPLFLDAALAQGFVPQLAATSAQTCSPQQRRALPVRLQSVMRERLGRLSEVARKLLDVAAVVGRGADFEQLHAVMDSYMQRAGAQRARRGESRAPANRTGGAPSPAMCLDALDELLLRQWLVVDAQTDDYTFAHDKVRESVLAEMSPARRAFLHAAVADCLASQEAPQHALIAEHEEQARRWTGALRHRLLAGTQAEQLFAVDEAISQYSKGLALAEQHPGAATSALASELLERRGLAHAWRSAVDQASADLRPAVDRALARDDTPRAIELLTTLGMTCQRADRYAQGSTALHDALNLARRTDDPRAAAVAMFWLGDIEWSLDHNAASSVWFQQVMGLCESARLADDVWVMAHHGLGEVAVMDARPAEGLAQLAQSLALARQRGDARLECENLIVIAWAHLGAHGTGQYGAALDHCEQVIALVQRADMPWYLAPGLIGRGAALCSLGRFQPGLECFAQAISISRDIGMMRFEAMARIWLAECCLDADEPGCALSHADCALRLMAQSGAAFFSHQLQAIRQQALIRLGRSAEVGDLAQDLTQARALWLGQAVLRTLDTQTEHFFRRGDLAGAQRSALEWADVALAHGVPEMHARAAAWSAEILARQGHHDAALSLADQLLAQPPATQRFSLGHALNRLAHRCAQTLGAPSVARYRARLSQYEQALAQAQSSIQSFGV
jgi:tetratricopeptide (TPR) repeat protein/transcriptional regulator with XRE-family HTH domain